MNLILTGEAAERKRERGCMLQLVTTVTAQSRGGERQSTRGREVDEGRID